MRAAVWSSSLAMPKSMSFTVPSRVTRTLVGFMSRWTMRSPWMNSSASAICAATSRTFRTRPGAWRISGRIAFPAARRPKYFTRSTPSTYSIAK
ncbi:MAG: hypothetical protein U0166_20190 [Acidobacteriota bacterium]